MSTPVFFFVASRAPTRPARTLRARSAHAPRAWRAMPPPPPALARHNSTHERLAWVHADDLDPALHGVVAPLQAAEVQWVVHRRVLREDRVERPDRVVCVDGRQCLESDRSMQIVRTLRDDDTVLTTVQHVVDGYVVTRRHEEGSTDAARARRMAAGRTQGGAEDVGGVDAGEVLYVKGRGVVRRASMARVVAACLRSSALERWYRVHEGGALGPRVSYTSDADADAHCTAQRARAPATATDGDGSGGPTRARTGPLAAWVAAAGATSAGPLSRRAPAASRPSAEEAAERTEARCPPTRCFPTWTLFLVHALDEFGVDLQEELAQSPEAFAPAVLGLDDEHFVASSTEGGGAE